MYVVCVTIRVKAERVDEFREATIANARGTREEPGNVRFDVLQGEEDRTKWFLYEAYRSKQDFTSHQQTPHYLAWREKVKDWMAEPRRGEKHVSVFPVPDTDW